MRKFFVSIIQAPKKCKFQKLLSEKFYNRNRIEFVLDKIEKEGNNSKIEDSTQISDKSNKSDKSTSN
jgi:hypothetical protein